MDLPCLIAEQFSISLASVLSFLEKSYHLFLQSWVKQQKTKS